MQSLRDIKRRIRSVKNISQITKAMEVVSMTKMRRTQLFALGARPYALAALDMLKNLLKMTPPAKLPSILRERKINTRLLLLVTTDKGLVGGFNDVIFRKADIWITSNKSNNKDFKIITVGKKAKEYFERRGQELAGSFIGHGDFVDMEETDEVNNFVIDGYKNKKWDSVTVIYTHFKTTLRQETIERNILPTKEKFMEEIIEEIIPDYGMYSELKIAKEKKPVHYNFSYKFEPNAEKILGDLSSNLIRIALHHILLESNASEHSARMVTMKNASENATELKDKLSLAANKARQAGITAELSEIIAGAEALQ